MTLTGPVDIALVRAPGAARGALSAMPVPPLGLLYVAGALLRAGRTVAVVDAEAEGLNDAAFVERVRALRPAVVGLSGMTPMRADIGKTITLCRPLARRLVLGGVHATRFHDSVLDEFPDLDAAVVGEGEEVAVALLEWWDQGGGGAPPAGVVVRDAPFVEAAVPADLGAMAWPARHLVPHERYAYPFQTARGFTTLISSRGCPFRCTFCDKTVSGSAWRARPPEDVVNELQEIKERYGLGYVCIFDDNFTLRRKRVVAICEEILRRGLRIDWKCEARVDGIDEELAVLMARAGCKTVAFGVESGNQDSLDFLKKDQQLPRMHRAIAACRAAGIETVAYVLVGIPGETPATSLNTLNFAKNADLDFIQFSTLSPFPGTELYEQAMREGWFRETAVFNPADGEELRATLVPPGWTEDELGATLRRMYGGFYLRPRYLARQAVRAGRQGTLLHRARLGLRVARWYLEGRAA
ncbi:MAG: radical SAM protein [Deltaproteobacteria bacterium]|nr:radical SAM protein [Deltaproteobacteria bacterium]